MGNLCNSFSLFSMSLLARVLLLMVLPIIIFMRNLLYIIAAIFIAGWFIAVYGYDAGGLIHVLLIVGILALILRLIGKKRPV